MEFALVLPLLVAGVLLVVQCAALAADHVAAQGLAAQLARTAAVDGSDARAAAAAAWPGRAAGVRVSRTRVPGDPAEWVYVEVRLHSRAFRGLGLSPEVVGRGVARAE